MQWGSREERMQKRENAKTISSLMAEIDGSYEKNE